MSRFASPRFAVLLAACVLVICAARMPARAQPANAPGQVPAEALTALQARSIGPAVTGGRIHDVEALPDDPSTVYVATASGGLWKSTNAGDTWTSLFDDQPVSTFGDVAIAPSNPDVVWAGTGEQQNRQSTSWGNGVYRSTDGGQTWEHLGLEATRHIGRVQVHPDDPDVAYVAALGNLWKGSEARGVYRTTDGGETWEKVFFADRFTGVVDLVMDPSNPDVLYAAAYQRLRRTWGFNGGGPGSGIYKTTDGGETWTELTDGIPGGDKGRIGLAVAQTEPQTVYALIEHADSSGTYRSRNGGRSWSKVNDLNPRPMYYSHITADPTDADRVYVLSTEAYVSEDGGDTFTRLPTRPTYDVGVHSDHHSIWVNPSNPEHFYLAGDAGLHVTHDRGQTYRRINNLPIGQFYAIGLDNRRPYRIYGGMQDNHSWMGPSATRRWTGIVNDDWRQIGFGDGMYQQVAGPRSVFVGSQNGGLSRVDPVTGDNMEAGPFEPAGAEYRFDWVTPSLVSRHDSSVVYFGGNRLFISRDRGRSWTRTKDLTRQIDRETLSLMGVRGSEPMLSKHDGTSSYGAITTIAESPLDADVLWVGTEDGNVQVSRDGGQSWTEVGANIAGVDGAPGERTYVSRVVASGADRGTAYAALDAHRSGDFAPYVYKTTDFGRSWTPVTDGLPADGSVNVIVEHPDDPQVLFLGTEHAAFVSTTAGEAWTKIDAGLPPTLYDDMAVHPRTRDLVIGTHGRSLWIWDDTTPMVEWDEAAGERAHLFSIQPATLSYPWKNTSYRGQAAYAGENPPRGAMLHYHLDAPVDSVELVVRNAAGDVVRRLDGPGTAGRIHRVVWDLEHPPPPTAPDAGNGDDDVAEPDTVLPALRHPVGPQGPLVSPGRYTVTLRAAGATSTKSVDVRPDPKARLTDAEWADREAFLVDLLELQRRAFPVAERAERIADSLDSRRDSLAERGAVPDGLEARADTAEARADRLDDVRDGLYGIASVFNMSGVTQPTLHPPREAHRRSLQELSRTLPTRIQQWEAFEDDL